VGGGPLASDSVTSASVGGRGYRSVIAMVGVLMAYETPNRTGTVHAVPLGDDLSLRPPDALVRRSAMADGSTALAAGHSPVRGMLPACVRRALAPALHVDCRRFRSHAGAMGV
jgi:hypothetical protein